VWVIAVRRPVSSAARELLLLLYAKKGAVYTRAALFSYVWDMASSAMELTAVLPNPAPVDASWGALYPYGSGFEGGGVVVGRPVTAAGRFEGFVNGGPVRGTVVVVATSCPRALQQHWDVVTVLGVARQWRGWPHRVDSDGKDRSRRLDATAWPCIVTEKAFEGAAGPPSRARCVSRTGVGGTVSRS
jgi:hypothetical protein